MKLPWESEDARLAFSHDWKGPLAWHEIVFEGEWLVTQREIQQRLGPEYEMYLGRAPRG